MVYGKYIELNPAPVCVLIKLNGIYQRTRNPFWVFFYWDWLTTNHWFVMVFLPLCSNKIKGSGASRLCKVNTLIIHNTLPNLLPKNALDSSIKNSFIESWIYLAIRRRSEEVFQRFHNIKFQSIEHLISAITSCHSLIIVSPCQIICLPSESRQFYCLLLVLLFRVFLNLENSSNKPTSKDDRWPVHAGWEENNLLGIFSHGEAMWKAAQVKWIMKIYLNNVIQTTFKFSKYFF